VETEKGREPRPNIIVPYPTGEDGLSTGGEGSAYAVAYVRPETNNVLYERAIVSALRVCAGTVYMANLNGALFTKDCILEEHFSSQFRFARYPRETIGFYPQIAERFRERFGLSVEEAPLVGSLQLADRPGFNAESLFETIVPESDFLDCWGQEFKRIGDEIVVNPNLPAVMSRYTPRSNVLVIVVKSRGTCTDFFTNVNRAIYTAITASHETPVLDGEKLDNLVWSEKIRRTYHLSTGHIMAMFDMANLIYVSERWRLAVQDTPLGRLAVSCGMDEKRLQYLKQAQLAFLGYSKEGAPLVHLPTAGAGKTVGESVEMLLKARGA
jgi:hypothetical protein